MNYPFKVLPQHLNEVQNFVRTLTRPLPQVSNADASGCSHDEKEWWAHGQYGHFQLWTGVGMGTLMGLRQFSAICATVQYSTVQLCSIPPLDRWNYSKLINVIKCTCQWVFILWLIDKYSIAWASFKLMTSHSAAGLSCKEPNECLCQRWQISQILKHQNIPTPPHYH